MKSPTAFCVDFKSKIHVLESNTNRLRNQHSAIQKLLQDRHCHKSLKEFLGLARETQMNIDELERRKYSSIQSENSDSSKLSHIDAQIKRVQKQLQGLSESVKRWEKDIQQQDKPEFEKTSRQVNHQKKQNSLQLERVEAHLEKFFASLASDNKNRINTQIHRVTSQLASQQIDKFSNQVETDIGMIICELEYLREEGRREEIEQKLRGINTDPQQGASIEIKMRELEIQLLRGEIQAFRQECDSRLMYETRLLDIKIDHLMDCIEINQQSNGKSPNQKSMPIKNHSQALQLRDRMARIQNDREGMAIKEEELGQKLSRLQQKVNGLKLEWKEDEEEQGHVELDGKILQCSRKLMSLFNQYFSCFFPWLESLSDLRDFNKVFPGKKSFLYLLTMSDQLIGIKGGKIRIKIIQMHSLLFGMLSLGLWQFQPVSNKIPSTEQYQIQVLLSVDN